MDMCIVHEEEEEEEELEDGEEEMVMEDEEEEDEEYNIEYVEVSHTRVIRNRLCLSAAVSY